MSDIFYSLGIVDDLDGMLDLPKNVIQAEIEDQLLQIEERYQDAIDNEDIHESFNCRVIASVLLKYWGEIDDQS